jgi:hypothetical protein
MSHPQLDPSSRVAAEGRANSLKSLARLVVSMSPEDALIGDVCAHVLCLAALAGKSHLPGTGK